VLYELFLAKLFGLKTVLLAQSMGPFDTVYMKIVGYLIRFLADVVTFRDSSSFYFWQQILSSDIKRDCSPDRPLADLIYLNKMPMATSASSPGPVIINLSNYVIESALQLEKDSIYPIGLHNNISDWVRLIEYFHLLTGRDLLLLPHTFRPGKGDDEYWLSKIFDKCPSELPVRKVSGPLAPNEIQKIVAESSFVVASRMHLALTAMKCGVPFLAIAYSHKYQQLVSPSFFEISPVIFLNEQCDGWPFSAIRERFELLWKDRQAYQNAIRLYAHKANLLAEENISFLTKIVKSSLRRC
jgi:polysaccharide pyruvyl transferase WcaK-like protein